MLVTTYMVVVAKILKRYWENKVDCILILYT